MAGDVGSQVCATASSVALGPPSWMGSSGGGLCGTGAKPDPTVVDVAIVGGASVDPPVVDAPSVDGGSVVTRVVVGAFVGLPVVVGTVVFDSTLVVADVGAERSTASSSSSPQELAMRSADNRVAAIARVTDQR
jgi:hypothetical protein